MTDNRTSEPTEEQVEAAAKALHETQNRWFYAHGDWGAAGFEIKQAFRVSARAALVAVQGAAPQAESDGAVTCRCRHGVGAHDFSDPSERCRMVGCRCQGWFGVAPVLPSSTVDEDALSEVIYMHLKGYQWPEYLKASRAVAEWLKEQGR